MKLPLYLKLGKWSWAPTDWTWLPNDYDGTTHDMAETEPERPCRENVFGATPEEVEELARMFDAYVAGREAGP